MVCTNTTHVLGGIGALIVFVLIVVLMYDISSGALKLPNGYHELFVMGIVGVGLMCYSEMCEHFGSISRTSSDDTRSRVSPLSTTGAGMHRLRR